MHAPAFLLGVASAVHTAAAFWMGDIAHQGLSPFNTDASYTVFRNVKDFGAKGDGGMLVETGTIDLDLFD